MLYNGKISLNFKTQKINVYTLKVRIYYKGKLSDIYEKTYVIGEKIYENLDLPIISITSDNYGLYDYETGILVPGKTYDENFVANPDALFIPGNYNNRTDEWTRNARITMFNYDGIKMLDQNIGLRVAGRTSALNPIKSFEIKADYDYDNKFNKFKINFNENTFSKNSILYEYKKLRLRSGAQDFNRGNIRSAIVSRLANQAGFVTQGTKRSLVYLNGKFYGIFDIQEEYSESYFINKFALDPNGIIEKYTHMEAMAFAETDIFKYFEKDLNIEENRKVLEKYVDMDNYLTYYAINILLNNTDWPQNNYMMWRYNGKYDNNNPYSDGRYRFMIYDTDIIYFNHYSTSSFEGDNADAFVSIMNGSFTAKDNTFKNVMKSEYYKNKFVYIILDLLNTTFSTENVLNVVEEESSKIQKMEEILSSKELHEKNLIEIAKMKEAIKLQEDRIKKNIETYFNFDETYELSIKVNEGIQSRINNIELYEGEQYKNNYYIGQNIVLQSQLSPGYNSLEYTVNGQKFNETNLTITNDMIQDNKVEIEICASKDITSTLIIYEISTKGCFEWIKLYNPSNVTINLNNLYLSDTSDNLKKFKLPNVSLEKNSFIIINAKDNYNILGEYICNFNLKAEEILYLYDDEKKEIIDSLKVPIMNEYETYGRYKKSNTFVYYDNYYNQRKSK